MEILFSIDVTATDDRELIETALNLAGSLSSGDFKVVDLSDLSADGRCITVRVMRALDAGASPHKDSKQTE